MSVLTEPRHTGEFLLSEASGSRSRDQILLKGSGLLEPGTILAEDGQGSYVALDLATLSNAAPGGKGGAAPAPALAVLLAATAAADGAKAVAITRDAELIRGALIYPAGAGDAERGAVDALLRRSGLIPR